MDIEIKNELLEYAEAQLPNEACGLIYCDGERLKFFPAQNVSPEPLDGFTIDCSDYVQAENLGAIEYIFHSHTYANELNGKSNFSPADRQACRAFGVPWLLLVLPQKEFKILHPKNVSLSLLGREWHWGFSDCYSLIREAIAEAGIYLTDYPRGELEIDGEYIWNVNPNYHPYEDYFAQEGFVQIPPSWQPQKYDLLLMCIESKFGNVNHAGIFIDPDRNIFYHHILGRLSEESVWGGYWMKVTKKIIRHRKFLGEPPCSQV